MQGESIILKILEKIGDKVFETVWGAAYDKFKEQFKTDDIRKAIKHATEAAISDYEIIQGHSRLLSAILDSSEQFLSTDLVRLEFQKLYTLHESPDSRAMACWFFDTGNPTLEEQDQVSEFIRLLSAKLRAEKELLPWFQANDIARIAEAVEKLVLQVPELSNYLIDDSQFMLDKSRNFAGREWIFSEIDKFIQNTDHPSGYFMIIGDPGIGKSAVMARLATDRGWAHHFNQRREGKNKPEDFIRNICVQLIAHYRLDPAAHLPFDIQSSATLGRILHELSDRPALRPVVLLIDALDEIEGKELDSGANPLYLPRILPPGVFIVLSVRDDDRYYPAVNSELKKFPIELTAPDHQRDVFDYLYAQCKELSVQNYLQDKNITEETFISDIAQKSEYNFMYLSQVIPELTQSKGIYHQLSLQELPEGLKGYYRDHWEIMKKQSGVGWFQLTLPVLVALSLEHKPITVERIQKLIPEYYKITGDKSEPPGKARIREALNLLSAFVHSEYLAGRTEQFRLYHESFYDFIADRNEIREERIELKPMDQALTSQLKHEFDQMD